MSCICPGYDMTFAECTVKGRSGRPGDATVWRGSAFDCSSANNEIALIHSLFGSKSSTVAAGECNSGSIHAHSVRVEGNCYTSQLYITVTTNMIGKTVECVYDNTSIESVIGTLIVATEGET